MALTMRILIAFPRAREKGFDMAGWEVRDMIDLGRIVRLESLIASEAKERFDPHERAGICMARMILDRLGRRLGKVQESGVGEPSDFAPFMLRYTVGKEENALALAFEVGVKVYLDCGPRDKTLAHLLEADRGRMYPSGNAIDKHNEFLVLDPAQMGKFISAGRYSALTDAPLMWAPCKDVAVWIDIDFKSAERAACEASKTPISEARVAAWGKYLRALGECDARAIFLFPSLDVTA